MAPKKDASSKASGSQGSGKRKRAQRATAGGGSGSGDGGAGGSVRTRMKWTDALTITLLSVIGECAWLSEHRACVLCTVTRF